MYILFTDETNMPSDPKAKFFVYGGLFFPIERLVEFDEGIGRIRKESGYKAGDELKFETNARPIDVTIEQARQAKERVVELCIKNEAKFIACVVLHKIARNQSQDDLVKWGANHVIGKFNYYLSQVSDYGVVAVDKLPINADYRYLSEKFCFGLEFQGEKKVSLDRIKLFAATCVNGSHASSAMDIVLGSFRYCINQPSNIPAAKLMMANVTKLIWHKRDGENIHAMELGLVFRPKLPNISVAPYKAEYLGLVDHINSLIADADEL
jgi:hypothetical protein